MKRTVSIEQFYLSITPYIFFLLMCGFIAYHLGGAYGFFPLFLGGYLGVASAAVAFIFFFRMPHIIKTNLQSNFIITYIHCSIFFYALAVTLIAMLYKDTPSGVVDQSFTTLVLWIAFFSLGFYLLRADVQKIIRFSYVFYILFLMSMIYYVINTGSVAFNLQGISKDDKDGLASYQALATNLLIVSLFLISYIKNTANTLFLIISSIFLFFLLGARSEFVGLLLFVTIFMLIKTRYNRKYFFMTTLSIVFLVVMWAVFEEDIISSRQFQLFNYSDSSSWSAREELENRGIKQIADNPILGNFGGHAINGEVGDYIHNSLSAYVNYGLYFYISYIGISVFTAFSSFLRLIKNTDNSEWWYSFSINIICLFLMMFSKPIFWAIPFFAWGVYFSAASTSNISINTSSKEIRIKSKVI